jgi:hypothetical protein
VGDARQGLVAVGTFDQTVERAGVAGKQDEQAEGV